MGGALTMRVLFDMGITPHIWMKNKSRFPNRSGSGTIGIRRRVQLTALVGIIWMHRKITAQIFLHVKGVFLAGIQQIFVLWVPGNIKLIAEKGPHTLHLQDALAIVHDGQLVLAHQLFAQFLIVDTHAPLASSGVRGIEQVDGLPAQGFRKLFQGAALLAAQEQNAGAVADDRFCMVFIDRF